MISSCSAQGPISGLFAKSVGKMSIGSIFHVVLNAVLSLEDQYIRQPTGDIVPLDIQGKKRFYPFFKDCIGAIDICWFVMDFS